MTDRINWLINWPKRLFTEVCYSLFFSSTWEAWYRKKESTLEPEIPMLEELMRSNKSRRILDFGCGIGRNTVYFAKRGYEVYGFDQSEEAVRRAELTLVNENIYAHLRVWNMVSPLPYETAFFDAVLVVRVIQHAYKEDILKILREIDRVLGDRGLLFIQEPSRETKVKKTPEERKPIWVEPRKRLGAYIYRKGTPRHLFTSEELLSMLKEYEILEIHSGTDHYDGHCVIARKLKH